MYEKYKKIFESICNDVGIDPSIFSFHCSRKERLKGERQDARFEAKVSYHGPFDWVVLYVIDYDLYLIWRRSKKIGSSYNVSKNEVMENISLMSVEKGIEFAWREQETVHIATSNNIHSVLRDLQV